MADSSIRIGIEGELDELLAKLSGIAGLDKAEVNAALAEGLRTRTLERFDKEQSPDGGSWKRSVRASESGGKTLTMTTGLKNSINARASAEGAEVGTNLVYAATHQFGASGRTIRARRKPYLVFKVGGRTIRKKQVTVNIPARPFLGISEEDRQDIQDVVNAAIEGAGG